MKKFVGMVDQELLIMLIKHQMNYNKKQLLLGEIELLPSKTAERFLIKQLRTISSSFKLAVAKSVKVQNHINTEKGKLEELNDLSYTDEQRQQEKDRIDRLKDELNGPNEKIKILKDKFANQITQIKESITKFLDTGTGTLSERIRTLFREQGITITSILTAIGMAIGVLVEAVLLGNASVINSSSGKGGDSEDKKKGGAKEWI